MLERADLRYRLSERALELMQGMVSHVLSGEAERRGSFSTPQSAPTAPNEDSGSTSASSSAPIRYFLRMSSLTRFRINVL